MAPTPGAWLVYLTLAVRAFVGIRSAARVCPHTITDSTGIRARRNPARMSARLALLPEP